MALKAAQLKALEMVQALGAGTGEIYLVGGFVRDTLLERTSTDIDLGVPGEATTALSLARQLANQCRTTLPGYVVSPFSLDPETGVARVVFRPQDKPHGKPHLEAGPSLQNWAELEPLAEAARPFYFDIAVLQGGQIKTDLARRDFTVNALAVPLAAFLNEGGKLDLAHLIDTNGGYADMRQRLIRPVSEQNLVDDPLRLLRGIRQRAQLSTLAQPWDFAPGTLELFRKHRALITRPAGERVREELTKTWLAHDPGYSLRLLHGCGLLAQLGPEIYPEGPVETRFEANFDAALPQAEAMQRLERLVEPPGPKAETTTNETAQAGLPEQSLEYFWPELMARLLANDRERLALLYWAIFLSPITDIDTADGKRPDGQKPLLGETFSEETGRVAQQVLARLHFSNQGTSRVAKMIGGWPLVQVLLQDFKLETAHQSQPSNRAIYRFLSATEPAQLEVLVYALVLQKLQAVAWQKQRAFTALILSKYWGNEQQRIYNLARLVDGAQLIQHLGIKPGPLVKQLLQEIAEAQAEGQISTSSEAFNFAKTRLDAL